MLTVVAACSTPVPASDPIFDPQVRDGVAAIEDNRGRARCSAVLTTGPVLRTAAHCLVHEDWRVRVATVSGQQVLSVPTAHVRRSSSQDQAEIALEGTGGEVSPIGTLPIASRDPRVGEEVVSVGYGEQGRLHSHRATVRQVDALHVLVEGMDGSVTCSGDSGGPLLMRDRGRLAVVGVLSGRRRQGTMSQYSRVDRAQP